MAVPKKNQDPAEGSEEVIDHLLERQAGALAQPASRKPVMATFGHVTLGELRRLLGDTDQTKFSAILALRPTLKDVEEAIAWGKGDGDVLAKTGRRLSGKSALRYHHGGSGAA